MIEYKFKTTVIEHGEEIELSVDFNDLGSLYSNIGRYGEELTKNIRQYTGYVDSEGTEIYLGDRIKLLEAYMYKEYGTICYGICDVSSDDSSCGGEGLGYYIQFDTHEFGIGDTEILGNMFCGNMQRHTTSSNLLVIKDKS